MKHLLQIAVLSLLVTSCSIARFQPVTDTYTGEVRVDSVMVLDSVYIDRIRVIREKADTVYITDTKTEIKYRYRDRVKVDTLILTETKTETQLVEKELTWRQKFRLKGFWYLLGVIALFVIWKIARLRLHL